MKIHLVFAHPSLQSFNGSMRNQALQTLGALGHSVSKIDLYQENFKCAADESDFTSRFNFDFFDLQVEQINALETNSFPDDIKREQKLLQEADYLLFQFPLWWYSVPALLKGYIDRVFTMGYAYGRGNTLAGKKAIVSITTGAPESSWVPQGKGTLREILNPLLIGTFGLCQIETLKLFVAYGVKRMEERERTLILNQYNQYLVEFLS